MKIKKCYFQQRIDDLTIELEKAKASLAFSQKREDDSNLNKESSYHLRSRVKTLRETIELNRKLMLNIKN